MQKVQGKSIREIFQAATQVQDTFKVGPHGNLGVDARQHMVMEYRQDTEIATLLMHVQLEDINQEYVKGQ